METSTPSFSARVRLYVTLIYQAVPLLVILFMLTERPKWTALLALAPLGLALVGLVMELMGRAVGRILSLTSLGLQALAIIGVLAFFFLTVKPMPKIVTSDLRVFAIALLPLGVFLWNLRGGTRKPVPPPDGFSRSPQ